jgi:GPH family glycoside/pentoside/hexuronide:cation symporter
VANRSKYTLAGVIAAIIIIVVLVIFIFKIPKERPEFQKDYRTTPPFFKALLYSLKNKAFILYLPTNLATWFVFGMLPTIVPLYGRFVLNIEQTSIVLGLLLAVAFIIAAISMSFWAWIARKIGARLAWIISLICWIISLAPFMVINSVLLAFITFAGVGFGMAGSLLMKDLIFSDIIDADELVTGTRREAGYFGIDFFFARLATILVFVAIGSVFSSVGWRIYDPALVTDQTVMGLKSLMFVFPAIALTIGLIFMILYPLHGSKLDNLKQKLAILHETKKKAE